MQEVQQDLGVACHRAGDVAQHDQRRRADDGAGTGELGQFAAAAERAAQGGRHVDARAARIGAEAAGAAEIEREAEAADLGFGVADLGGRHLLEIHRLQHLAVADRHDGVELGRLDVGLGCLACGRHRLGNPALTRRRLGGRGGDRLAEHGERGLLEGDGRVAPEESEGLVEDLLVLAARGE